MIFLQNQILMIQIQYEIISSLGDLSKVGYSDVFADKNPHDNKSVDEIIRALEAQFTK